MTFVAFTNGIPNPTNDPSVDVNTMTSNNNAVPQLWPIDHFGYNNNNGGLHKQVTMFNESAPGLPNSTNGALYCNSGLPFWQNASSSTNQLAFQGASSLVNNGFTTIGGLTIQWGNTTSTSSGINGNVTFPTPFLTTLFSLQICVLENSNSRRLWHLNSVTTSGFTAYIQDSSGSSVANFFYWFAVGK